MKKKYEILMLAFIMSVVFSGYSLAQYDEGIFEEESPSIEEFAEERSLVGRPEAVSPLDRPDSVYGSREGARVYYDGYRTYVNSDVMFELQTSDNIYADTVYYSINGGAEVEYTTPFNIEEEGKARITYYSVDMIGNVEDRREFVVYVDNTPPEIGVILSAPFIYIGDRIYVSESFVYTYSITASDNISGVANIQYSADGQRFQEFIGPVEIASATGPVMLDVMGIDRVGNFTTQYASKIIDESGNIVDLDDTVEFFVDNQGPVVEIIPDRDFVMKNGKKIASRDYRYTVSAFDEHSGVSEIFFRINSKGDFIPYTGELQLPENGEYLIEAVAKDKVGNLSETAKLEVYVDTIQPKSKIEMLTP